MGAVAIVGAGPRGTSVLERLVANAPLLAPGARLDIHLVDPFPPGGGRVWRSDQSDLLWLNSAAADNTIYPDESVQCDGPVATGPGLVEWAAGPGELPAEEAGEAARVHPSWFPSRRLYSAYLDWVVRRAVAAAPDGVAVHQHRGRAVDLGEDGGRQLVWLDGDPEPLAVDCVILAQGHQDVGPTVEEARQRAFAGRHGLTYLPTAYSADPALDALRPGQEVIVRGLGLAFVDCMVLLGEGRGGRYHRGADGTLAYRPSGDEPVLLAGSGRGVPYHSKTAYPLQGPRPALPHFLAPDRLPDGTPLEMAALWPLIGSELAYAYYHELFAAHPERTRGGWEAFLAGLEATVGDPAGRARLAERAVPATEDRLDLRRLDRPLDGVHPADLGRWMDRYIAADLARRRDPSHSADLGLITGLLSSFASLAGLAVAGRLSARARAEGVERRFFSFFSYVASGPPPPRLEEMGALARAGVLRFLGPGTVVEADPGGWWQARSATGADVRARALLDARLPAPSLDTTADPLVQALRRRGECSEEVAVDPDGYTFRSGRLRVDRHQQVLDAAGVPHPARLAVGAGSSGGRWTSGVARPGVNAGFFRQNDAVARRAIELACRSAVSGSRP